MDSRKRTFSCRAARAASRPLLLRGDDAGLTHAVSRPTPTGPLRRDAHATTLSDRFITLQKSKDQTTRVRAHAGGRLVCRVRQRPGISIENRRPEQALVTLTSPALTRAVTGSPRYRSDVPTLRSQNGRLDDAEIGIVELRKVRLERVVLVGVAVDGTLADASRSLEELRRLAETAGAEVVETAIQRRDHPDAGTFIGKGKAQELALTVKATGADTVVMDDELSPGQLRQLEELLDVKVIDRTALILDIFAQHATSKEGKAQVELAQLNYLLPRLRGWGQSLTRLGGGIGTRGPGETKMEVDRRRIRRRITKLRHDLSDFGRTREVKRQGRERADVPGVALAGYTNAGKSTLLNRLAGSGVLVEDKLFSTLDPTTRRLDLPGGRHATLTDTVGFISKLPHDLIEAFKSTLEEVGRADLVLHLVDGSGPDPVGQAAAVRLVLDEVGAGALPELLVVTKIDLVDGERRSQLTNWFPYAPQISATSGEGVEALLHVLAARLPRPSIRLQVLVPYERGDLVHRIHQEAELLSTEHVAEGTRITLRAASGLAHALAPFTETSSQAASDVG